MTASLQQFIVLTESPGISPSIISQQTVKYVKSTNGFWEIDCQLHDDKFFRTNFRMNRESFKVLCDHLKGMNKEDSVMCTAIPLKKRVAIALYAMGSSAEYRSVANLFGIAESTVVIILHEFCKEIWSSLRPLCMNSFPLTAETVRQNIDGFQRMGLPQCFGAIDGCHVEINPKEDEEDDYRNSKGWFSTVLLALVDHRQRFIYISVGSPGRFNDSQIYQNSQLKKALGECELLTERSTILGNVKVPVYIIGDSGFRLSPNLMKPYSNYIELNSTQKNFNETLSKCRKVVEKAFGHVKARFQRISKGIDNTDNANAIIMACCVLHNFLNERNDHINNGWMHNQEIIKRTRPNPEHTSLLYDNDVPSNEIRSAIASSLINSTNMTETCNDPLDLENVFPVALNENRQMLDFQRRLIVQVRNNPMLYNPSNKQYGNIKAVDAKWKQIATRLKTNVNECRSTWANLRVEYQSFVKTMGEFYKWANTTQQHRPVMDLQMDMAFMWRFAVKSDENMALPCITSTSDAPVVTVNNDGNGGNNNNDGNYDNSGNDDTDPDIMIVEDKPIEIIDVDAEYPMLSYEHFIVTPEIRRLVGIVVLYEELYNSKHRYFHDYKRKGLIWTAIATEMGEKATKLMKTWFHLIVRYEWELLNISTKSTSLMKLCDFLSIHITINPDTVVKQSYYLKTLWYEPIDNFRNIHNLLTALKKRPAVVSYTETFLFKRKTDLYDTLWLEISRSRGFSAGRCEVTWLVSRSFYQELFRMRQHGYQLQDKWYFENFINEFYTANGLNTPQSQIATDVLPMIQNDAITPLTPSIIKRPFTITQSRASVTTGDNSSSTSNNTADPPPIQSEIPLSLYGTTVTKVSRPIGVTITPTMATTTPVLKTIIATTSTATTTAITTTMTTPTLPPPTLTFVRETLAALEQPKRCDPSIPVRIRLPPPLPVQTPISSSNNTTIRAVQQPFAAQRHSSTVITLNGPKLCVVPRATAPSSTVATQLRVPRPQISTAASNTNNQMISVPAAAISSNLQLRPIALSSSPSTITIGNANNQILVTPGLNSSNTQQRSSVGSKSLVTQLKAPITAPNTVKPMLVAPKTNSSSVQIKSNSNKTITTTTTTTTPSTPFPKPSLPVAKSSLLITPKISVAHPTTITTIPKINVTTNAKTTTTTTTPSKVTLPTPSITPIPKASTSAISLPQILSRTPANILPTVAPKLNVAHPTAITTVPKMNVINTTPNNNNTNAKTTNPNITTATITSMTASKVIVTTPSIAPITARASTSTISPPQILSRTPAANIVPSVSHSSAILLQTSDTTLPRITNAVSLLSSNEIMIQLVATANGNKLVVQGPPLSENFSMSMERTAIFIRIVMSIPLLHNKSAKTTPRVLNYWQYLSKMFDIPVHIMKACWNFLLENFVHFRQIAPMEELTKPITDLEINIWEETTTLFDQFEMTAREDGWYAFKDHLPGLLDAVGKQPLIYQYMVEFKDKLVIRAVSMHEIVLNAWRKLRSQYKQITIDLVTLFHKIVQTFCTYIIDLENNIDNKWHPSWWPVFAELKYIVALRYTDTMPLYHIVHNKIDEEVERCSRVEMLELSARAQNNQIEYHVTNKPIEKSQKDEQCTTVTAAATTKKKHSMPTLSPPLTPTINTSSSSVITTPAIVTIAEKEEEEPILIPIETVNPVSQELSEDAGNQSASNEIIRMTRSNKRRRALCRISSQEQQEPVAKKSASVVSSTRQENELDILSLVKAKSQTNAHNVFLAMRRHSETYESRDPREKQKAWQKIADDLHTSVDICQQSVREAYKLFQYWKLYDPDGECHISRSYFKPLEAIYRAVQRMNGNKLSVRTPNEVNETATEGSNHLSMETAQPDQFIHDIGVDTCENSLVVANWAIAVASFSKDAQNILKAKLKSLVEKYKATEEN